MTRKLNDFVGQKIGRLFVVERVANRGKSKRAQWRCVCECGREVVIRGDHLQWGAIKSCGCLRSDTTRERNTTHGKCHENVYSVWKTMRQRCTKPNSTNYARYGGRSIHVCNEWKSDFMAFYTWSMENGYVEGLTIDRIDNDGNYEPTNCR